MNQISIDFVAGTHGQFLEFVCNKYIANLAETNYNPFNELGASHKKSAEYHKQKIFLATHYSNYKFAVFPTVIRIQFDADDLLNLSSVSLLRAADVGIDNDVLEENTYHKLNNKFYQSLLDNLCLSYPDIRLSASNPNCPRYVLREFFKFGFKDPENHGLMQLQRQMVYDSSHNVFDFEFKNFYNTDMFVKSIHEVGKWLGQAVSNTAGLIELHCEFLQKQIYKNSKVQADQIISAVKHGCNEDIPKLSLLQESYINATLENLEGVEMPFAQHEYFSNVKQILNYLHDAKSKSLPSKNNKHTEHRF